MASVALPVLVMVIGASVLLASVCAVENVIFGLSCLVAAAFCWVETRSVSAINSAKSSSGRPVAFLLAMAGLFILLAGVK